jgi:hypothetical protein
LEELVLDGKNQINLYIYIYIYCCQDLKSSKLSHTSVLSNDTAVIPVRFLVSSCGIFGGKTFAFRRVSPSTSVSPSNSHSVLLSSAIMDWRNGPYGLTCSHSTLKIKKWCKDIIYFLTERQFQYFPEVSNYAVLYRKTVLING